MNPLRRLRGPLRPVGGVPADDADGERLGDVLGDRKKLGDRLERFSPVVLVKPRDDHAFSPVSKFLRDIHDPHVEELPLIDPHDLRIAGEPEYVGRILHAHRLEPCFAVRHDVIGAVAVIDPRFEYSNLLAGYLRPAYPANQFFGLAAEHAAGNDLDPAGFLRGVVGGRGCHICRIMMFVAGTGTPYKGLIR